MLDVFLQQLVNGLTLGMAYALIATGLALIFGIMGIINFAHGAFYVIAAYTVIVLMGDAGLGYLTAIPVALVVVVCIGLAVQRTIIEPLLKTHALNALLATFALSILIQHLAQHLFGSEGRQIATPFDAVVRIGPLLLTEQKCLVLGGGAVVLVALGLFLERNPMGKLMRAVAQNRYGAAVLGIDVALVERYAFGLGIALAGAGGLLVGPLAPIMPETGYPLTLKAFAAVILGGLGSVKGAILAGFLLGIIESLASAYLSTAWKDGFAYLVLIAVLLVRPSGLFGQASR